jgi:hypothetical protein
MIGKPRSLRWKRAILGLLTALLIVYVGSYHYLSRRGMTEAKEFGFPGILYVRWDEITKQDCPALLRHYRLAKFYAPLNAIDCAWFGGKGPVRGMTFGLSR